MEELRVMALLYGVKALDVIGACEPAMVYF
jgi:hypothetical protein